MAVVSLEVPSRKGRYLWRIITCLWWGRHVVGDRVAENGPFAVARAGVDYSARSLPPASLTDTVSSLSLLLTLLLSPFLTMATRAGYNKNSSGMYSPAILEKHFECLALESYQTNNAGGERARERSMHRLYCCSSRSESCPCSIHAYHPKFVILRMIFS